MKVRFLKLTLLVVILAQLCAARLEPHFNLEWAAWEATDAVIVSQVGKQRFRVTDVWNGALKIGDIVELRKVSDRALGGTMILFLKELRRSDDSTDPTPIWFSDENNSDFRIRTAWVAEDRTSCYVLVGPTEGDVDLENCRISTRDLKAEASRIFETRRELVEASRVPNKFQRAELLRDFLISEQEKPVRQQLRIAWQFVYDELGNCHNEGAPVLHAMIDDHRFARGAVIRAFAKAGGTSVAPELQNRLQENIKFWRSLGPNIPDRWWEAYRDQSDQAEQMRSRHSEAGTLVEAMRDLRYRPALPTVVELRALWSNRPELNIPDSFPRGPDYLTRTCDAFIRSVSPLASQ